MNEKILFSSMYGKKIDKEHEPIFAAMKTIQDHCNKNKCLDCKFNLEKDQDQECYFKNTYPYLYDPTDLREE